MTMLHQFAPHSTVVAQPPTSTAATDFKAYAVLAPDGVSLSVREWGNPDGPEIVFIHGFAQSQLVFTKQTRSELAKHFRIVTYDLRGHGESDKPTNPDCYIEGKHWADDVQAVLDAARLKRPVLVGWSLGGRVIAQYLSTYGDAHLAGVNFVGSRTVANGTLNTLGPAAQFLIPMQSANLETNIAATIDFIRGCVNKPLSSEEFSLWLAFNMTAPHYARAATLKWPGNFETALESTSVPALVTHGKADQVILPSAGAFTASKITASRISLYDDIGHAPFWESAARFNAELAGFVNDAQQR